MSGYIVVKSSSEITLGDLRSLVAKGTAMSIPNKTPVHFGFVSGQMVLALPADINKQNLPPTATPERKQPMKPAKRRGRQ